MLIKSLTRKSKSFGQLIRYINTPAEGLPVSHNLPMHALQGDDAGVEKAFLDNARYIRPRKNGVWCYHEILAFHAEDNAYLTDEVLRDLAQQWLTWRAPDCLAYARIHRDTAHPHVHCIIAANTLYASKKHWLKKTQFAQLKRQLEQYQQQHYPLLSASLAQPPEVAKQAPMTQGHPQSLVATKDQDRPQICQARWPQWLQTGLRLLTKRWWRRAVGARTQQCLGQRKTFQGHSR